MSIACFYTDWALKLTGMPPYSWMSPSKWQRSGWLSDAGTAGDDPSHQHRVEGLHLYFATVDPAESNRFPVHISHVFFI